MTEINNVVRGHSLTYRMALEDGRVEDKIVKIIEKKWSMPSSLLPTIQMCKPFINEIPASGGWDDIKNILGRRIGHDSV